MQINPKWTPEDRARLVQLQAEFGSQWAKIAREMKTKSVSMVRQEWFKPTPPVEISDTPEDWDISNYNLDPGQDPFTGYYFQYD
jgi:aspartate aminotransferase-like enzyme